MADEYSELRARALATISPEPLNPQSPGVCRICGGALIVGGAGGGVINWYCGAIERGDYSKEATDHFWGSEYITAAQPDPDGSRVLLNVEAARSILALLDELDQIRALAADVEKIEQWAMANSDGRGNIFYGYSDYDKHCITAAGPAFRAKVASGLTLRIALNELADKITGA